MGLLNFSNILHGSRTIAPEKNCPPNRNPNPNPTLNSNRGSIFLGGNFPGTILSTIAYKAVAYKKYWVHLKLIYENNS